MTRWMTLAIVALLAAGCPTDDPNPDPSDYRQDMRDFVQAISAYAKQRAADFAVIPQNGEELVTTNSEHNGPVASDYLAAIDGQGREDFFYGYTADNVPTPSDDREWMQGFLDIEEANGVEVLVTDYCSTPLFMQLSYVANNELDYISFAADRRDLDHVPGYPADPYNDSTDNIAALSDARNFLYVLDPGGWDTREDYLAALAASDHDVLIIDAFVDGVILTAAEVDALRTKASGGTRLVIAYMSIGEAEDYRYYWEPSWRVGSPAFIEAENPDWAGNYKVRYWDPEWQAVIFGSTGAYLDRILAAGFDGVYLDIIDAYEFFE